MVKQRVHGQKPRKKNKEAKGPKKSPEAAAAAEAFASAGGSKLAKKKHLRGGLSGKQQLAARLRAEARGGPFFLKMNMDVGHAGPAARFQRLVERAHDQAFALRIFGLTDREPVSHK